MSVRDGKKRRVLTFYGNLFVEHYGKESGACRMSAVRKVMR
jgi:hypothetical protein